MKSSNWTMMFLAVAAMYAVTAGVVYAQSERIAAVGEKISFRIAAIDAQGDTIRDWNTTGETVTLKLHNSTANGDSSFVSWSAYSDGYTWARILHNDEELPSWTENEWMLEPQVFEGGVAELSLIHTKAESDVYIQPLPATLPVRMADVHYTFLPGPFEELCADITWPREGEHVVYVYRPFELYIALHDRYTNVCKDTVAVILQARYPSELDYVEPTFDPPADDFRVAGSTQILLYGSLERASVSDMQILWVHTFPDMTRHAKAGEFTVLSHAPGEFLLLLPEDGERFFTDDREEQHHFVWSKPDDPYTDMRVSQFGEERVSDVVTYEVWFHDAASGVKRLVVDANQQGKENAFTCANRQLVSFAEQLAQSPLYVRSCDMLWTVRASDGLSETRATTPALHAGMEAHLLTLDYSRSTEFRRIDRQARQLAIVSNFPNPFTTSTSIQFSLPLDWYVSLTVHDNIGRKVATLIDGAMEAGTYLTNFITDGLPAGVYTLRLEQQGRTVERVVVKVK